MVMRLMNINEQTLYCSFKIYTICIIKYYAIVYNINIIYQYIDQIIYIIIIYTKYVQYE